jgi:hypothetical protein
VRMTGDRRSCVGPLILSVLWWARHGARAPAVVCATFMTSRARTAWCDGLRYQSTGGVGMARNEAHDVNCVLIGRRRFTLARQEFVVDKGGATVSADEPTSRRFAIMAQIESKHDVRRKVRDAQAQANRDRLQRESDNREDMVAFLVAEQKAGAVSQWEAERHKLVRQEADQRRAEQRLEGARALARMRDRGETVTSIAQLGECSTKVVRRYLKELRSASSVAGPNADDGSRALRSDEATTAVDVSQAPDPDGEDSQPPVESHTAAAGLGVHPKGPLM